MIKKINQHIEEGFEARVLNPIEYWLWKFRYIALLAVFFCAFASIALFVMGTMEILSPVKEIIITTPGILTNHEQISNENILKDFIGALDLYLIAVFFLIFSFGLYELIISKIDIAHDTTDDVDHPLLQISSLDELKSKIIKVIIIILIVAFFKNVISMKMVAVSDAFMLSLAILALCIGSYFLTKAH
ncbi:MAG TPA: YqhA family protein [Methanospirillum sp.]|uniref:YqhA family protein n=1 Tax=Methanospirillum sp. TaxID=45200 RepID=UPI002D167704|nr:YqhA family protein [Methanospirillum sp.]HWQ63992.1 YqhA family protein [Methanospirillum sp.]